MKKLVIFTLILSLFVATMVGCSSDVKDSASETAQSEKQTTDGISSTDASEAKKVTIRFSAQSMDVETSVTLKILKQFEEDYPNVTLELEESPGNDLITKINTDIMGDNAPDIFAFWRPEAKWNVDKYIAKGAIADLTTLVREDEFFEDLLPDYAWRTATVDGKVVAIPRQSFYVEFLVNKVIFDKYDIPLPTDWDSLVNATIQLKKNGIIPWAVDTKEGLDDSSRIFNAIINRTVGNPKGLELLKGNESFQSEEVIKALGYMQEVVKNNAPEDAAALGFDQVIAKYFNTGKAGMILGNAGQIDVNLSEEIMQDLVALPFPLTPQTVLDKPSLEQDITNLIYISSKAYEDADKKEYVIELMKRLVSKEAAKRYYEEERFMVPHEGLDIDSSKVSKLQLSAAQVANASPGDKWLLSFAKPGPVDDFRIAINEFWRGEYTPEEFAARLDEALYGK